jgi:hypothetical protein
VEARDEGRPDQSERRMSEFLEHERRQQQQQEPLQPLKPLKRELDSTDDFEHLEHEMQQQPLQQPHQQPLLDLSNSFGDYNNRDKIRDQSRDLLAALGDDGSDRRNLLDTSVPASNGIECDLKPVPATPPPSADLEKFELGDAARQPEPVPFGAGEDREQLGARLREQLEDFKDTAVNLVGADFGERPRKPESQEPRDRNLLDEDDDEDMFAREEFGSLKEREPPMTLYGYGDIKSSSLPEPENSPELDFVKDEIIVHEATRELPRSAEGQLWNVLEKSGSERFEEREVLEEEPPNKPLPPLPNEAEHEPYQDEHEDRSSYGKDLSNEYVESRSQPMHSDPDTGDEEFEFESEPEPSPAKSCSMAASAKSQVAEVAEANQRMFYCQKPPKNREIEEIAAKDIFRRIGIGEFSPRVTREFSASLLPPSPTSAPLFI